MFKKIVFLSILVLTLPFTAFAGSSVDFTNSGGTLAGTNSGLTLPGSVLIAVNGLGGGLITGNDLGAISFSTGVLSSGSLQMGGTFASGRPVQHYGQRHQRCSDRRHLQRLFYRTGDLDSGNPGQWNPQLHSDRFSDWNLV